MRHLMPGNGFSFFHGMPRLPAALTGAELSPDYILPNAFDTRIGPAVVKAVADARKSGVARA